MKKAEEIKKKRQKEVNKWSIGFWIDVVISWCLIYLQTNAADHARKGKLIRGPRRWWCLFLYWLAHKLSSLRNYDDIDSSSTAS